MGTKLIDWSDFVFIFYFRPINKKMENAKNRDEIDLMELFLFTKAIIEASKNPRAIPPSFYEQYYWGNIASNMLAIMQRKY